MSTDAQRRAWGRLGALRVHGHGKTNTGPARAALAAKFERLADPDGVLPPEVRAKRADMLRRAFLIEMSLKAVDARQLKRKRLKATTDPHENLARAIVSGNPHRNWSWPPIQRCRPIPPLVVRRVDAHPRRAVVFPPSQDGAGFYVIDQSDGSMIARYNTERAARRCVEELLAVYPDGAWWFVRVRDQAA